MIFKPAQQLLAAALLVMAGSVGAGQVNILGTYDVKNGGTVSIHTTASDHDANGQPNGAAYQSDYFYELVVNAYDAVKVFLLGGPHAEAAPVRYFLWEDNDPVRGAASIMNADLAVGTPAEAALPLTVGQNFQYSLPPGQYILQIQKNESGWKSITTNVSSVPLPGALWMFGAALVGFVGFSSRRKV